MSDVHELERVHGVTVWTQDSQIFARIVCAISVNVVDLKNDGPVGASLTETATRTRIVGLLEEELTSTIVSEFFKWNLCKVDV